MILIFIFTVLTLVSHAQQLPMPQGTYARGRLEFAWQLPDSGEGYRRLFVHRNRGWGSQPLIEMIERASIEMSQLFPLREPLKVGDISSMKGGKISRHNSHQNGLDVDLAYYRLNGTEHEGSGSHFLENMVRKGRLSRNFDVQRNWELIKNLNRYGKVQRIFVDRAIKREICKYTKKMGEQEMFTEVLRTIRPFPHHSNHLHVRLHCPDYADKCVKQEDPEEGSGC